MQYQEGASNLFALESPELYGCYIHSFTSVHATLTIMAECALPTPDERILCFDLVVYMDLPYRWEGANFFVGSDAECLAILQKIDFLKTNNVRLGDNLATTILADYRLFCVTTSAGYVAKIIANGPCLHTT